MKKNQKIEVPINDAPMLLKLYLKRLTELDKQKEVAERMISCLKGALSDREEDATVGNQLNK